jgi:hypothetical protein
MIPGSNILKLALTVIGSQNVNWFQFASVTTGPTGLDVTTYSAPQTVTLGSVQPIDRARYEALGLDLQKSYVNWFVPNVNALSVTRNPDGNGDVIEWPVTKQGALISGVSRRYQLVGDTPWTQQDNWTRVLGVDVGPATGNTTNA